MTDQIKSMLDTLADYEAHRDLLAAEKRALLDDVRVPEEVQAVVSAGMKRMSEVCDHDADAFAAQIETELSAVVIPEEIKAQLAEIDRQRAAIMERKRRRDFDASRSIEAQKRAIQAEVEAQTKDIYAAIEQRRRDIEAEFAGKAGAVDDNIRKLTEQIKAEIKALGESVKGQHYHAVYVRGRVTWDTSGLDGYAVGHPEILFMRKEGDPSVTIRKI